MNKYMGHNHDIQNIHLIKAKNEMEWNSSLQNHDEYNAMIKMTVTIVMI